MSKRSKRLATLLMAAVLTLGSALPVSAANTTDRAFEFVSSGAYTYTNAYAKTNSTPIYVLVDAMRPAAKIKVYGLIPYPTTADPLQWINCTYTPSGATEVTAQPGVKSSIRSTVYEKKGTSVRLNGRSTSATSKTCGVWSADSTREYTVLNY